ncbi:SrfA family protein [Klebsiella sp. BIGb0407]|uniref:SrfA family protein n=1 Tax=Klebsiella sp. BIGb0407 TaxID=2940603 RepID=UPI0021693819|nr:SrfA family protein [Klebsiella sp. BIGb0407]MCS3431089.1 hypothetical protein [Klebsiella sp. BIGb0407]
MRNSIQGSLLRTGHNSSLKALGETGYPVFKMAFQLREAIHRLDAGRDLARHLAVPQNDQGGDRTDWYSSFPGDVIPWSSASESERASARSQFDEFQIAVQALSEQLLNTEQSGAGGDRKVFAKLLKSVIYFPDYDYVYLVNGVLVITFWGFIHQTGEQRNPMHWLAPASQPLPTESAPPLTPAEVPQATPNIPIETTRRTWRWRWLLWLLLALFLLALVLGLLRGCVPSLSLPGLPAISVDNTQPPAVSPVDIPPASNIAVPSHATLSGNTLSEDEIIATAPTVTDKTLGNIPPLVSEPLAASESQEMNPSENNAADVSTDPAQPAAGQETQSDNAQQPAVTPNTLPPVIPPQGKPLTLPPTLPDGPAQFLNGQWRVNGGIQDKQTGRPLQLQYNFEQGKGDVSVRQSSGVTCTGPASGNVQQGALSITNPEQMKCSDGSNFIVPDIECKSPDSGHTDCVGSNNGEKTFPIRMLQPNS